MERYDIAIVGGGAAGLACAIFAKEAAPTSRVVVLDGAKKLGAKILVSGGGRCNVTHHRVTPDDYAGPRNRVKNVLAAFTVAQTVAWFSSLGVTLKREDTGKLFPTTDDAHTVLDALLRRCADLGVTILTESRITIIHHDGDVFTLRRGLSAAKPRTPGFPGLPGLPEIIESHNLVLATGGRSLPRTGSDGGGYDLARALGHTVTHTAPALVPLVLDDTFFHAAVSGIAHDVTLTTKLAGRSIDRRTGSLLWTHFGVSGPVVMDASRHFTLNPAAKVHANLLPNETFDSVDAHLVHVQQRHPKRTAGRVLGELLPQRVADALLTHLRFDPQNELVGMSRESRRALVHALTDLPLPVLRDRGWNYAEVTAGGVPLDEVDTATMQSRRTPGLYFVGEILDVDGRIGGFNFQWAWCTARIAGRAAAASSFAQFS